MRDLISEVSAHGTSSSPTIPPSPSSLAMRRVSAWLNFNLTPIPPSAPSGKKAAPAFSRADRIAETAA